MKRPSSGGRKSTRSTDKSSKGPKRASTGPRTGKTKAAKSGSKPSRAGSGRDSKPTRAGSERVSRDPDKRFSKAPSERYSKESGSSSDKPERFSKAPSERFSKDSSSRTSSDKPKRFSKDAPARGSKTGSARGSKDRPARGSKESSYSFDKDTRARGPREDESKYSSDSDRKTDSGQRKYKGDKPVYTKGKPFVKRSRMAGPSDPSKGIRLNKYVANSGVCSRREADEFILAGVVSVNDEVVIELGTKVMYDDVVRYNGAVIRNEKPVYILLNKPKDYITTTDDPKDRKTVMQLIAQSTKARVYPVGRLDRNTTGLLLLTNDGDLTTRLTHPSFQTPKIYAVGLDKTLKASDLQKIAEGVELEDGFIKPDAIKYSSDDKKSVGIEIHSGKNRIVRRIFAHLGYEVVKLDRVMFAGLTKKDIPRGKFRNLTDIELSMLKMMTGKKKQRHY